MSLEKSPWDPKSPRNSTRFGVTIAGAYLLVSGAWILFSDRLASTIATSEAHLAAIQSVKGLGFVFATAVALFLFSRYLFRRVARQAEAALRAEAALNEMERSAIASIILQSIVHDFRNHTQVAWGNLQLILPDISLMPPGQQELLQRIRQSVSQLVDTLERNQAAGVRSFAQPPTAVDLTSVIGVGLDLLRRHPKAAGCTLELIAPEPVTLPGHRALIHDALTNMVVNAAEALGGHGAIQVRIVRTGEGAVIEVHDNGPGIPEAERGRVMQTFYTTKAGGTGLGLLTVKACAQMHGGTVTVGASDLGGACIRMSMRGVTLAAAADGQTEAAAPAR